MRIYTLIFCALLLGACSQSDTERARAKAQQTADEVKHDSRVALDKAEVEARKANKELTRDLDKARDKVDSKLDEHTDRK